MPDKKDTGTRHSVDWQTRFHYNQRMKKSLPLILIFVTLTACASPAPTPTLAPQSVESPGVTATATEQATETSVPDPTEVPSPTSTPEPTLPTGEIRVSGVTLPPGFSIHVFAEIDQPTGLTFARDGRLLVTSATGRIYALEDRDQDGLADQTTQLAYGFASPLGIAVNESGDTYWVSSSGKISVLRDTDGDGEIDAIDPLVTGLTVGRHQNDNLKFGPDGFLYMGMGSTCDACRESDPTSAGLLRIDPETGDTSLVATGLRNPYDLAFHPLTGDLFASDNGRDDLGDDAPYEELNHIVEGGDYGWPFCWDDFQGSRCEDTIQAIAFFQPHSSVNSMEFYTEGPFPERYHNGLFLGVFGSWLTEVDRGIWFVSLAPDGDTYQAETEWFGDFPSTAWLLGLTVGPDGALYVGDYINNQIYRISYGN